MPGGKRQALHIGDTVSVAAVAFGKDWAKETYPSDWHHKKVEGLVTGKAGTREVTPFCMRAGRSPRLSRTRPTRSARQPRPRGPSSAQFSATAAAQKRAAKIARTATQTAPSTLVPGTSPHALKKKCKAEKAAKKAAKAAKKAAEAKAEAERARVRRAFNRAH